MPVARHWKVAIHRCASFATVKCAERLAVEGIAAIDGD
jgi:hypothetical protein